MTNFDDFFKNLRIFDNFPKDFGGVFFTPQFSHFIAQEGIFIQEPIDTPITVVPELG